MISRRDEPAQNGCSVYKPLVAVIVQGYERSIIGSEEVQLRKEPLLGGRGGHAECGLRHGRIPGGTVLGGDALPGQKPDYTDGG